MRVSILVNSVDPTTCHDYAVLWLDPMRHVWARQMCAGIALPPEGTIVDEDGMTLLTDAHAHAPTLLTLGDFRLDARERLTSIRGAAAWFSQTRQASVDGRWQLRAIERTPAEAPRRRAGNESATRPQVSRDGRPGQRECR